ncbi:Guanine nucleotide-binding protein alpha-2 subunit [Toensbergia leucococca]|nr:Guanine nucleotide-binding protein alpha-2 subunit [Toensbergia leucococca]
MGACMSSADSGEEDQKKRSRIIDAKLEEDSRRLKKECKILLLGSGESGKSTIVKQMKIIHQNGYTVDELALYRLTVYKNLIDCAKALIGAMRQFEIEPGNPENNQYGDYLLEYQVDPDPHMPLDPRAGAAVVSIWKDASIAAVMDHQSEFYLMDSAP